MMQSSDELNYRKCFIVEGLLDGFKLHGELWIRSDEVICNNILISVILDDGWIASYVSPDEHNYVNQLPDSVIYKLRKLIELDAIALRETDTGTKDFYISIMDSTTDTEIIKLTYVNNIYSCSTVHEHIVDVMHKHINDNVSSGLK